MVKLKDCCEVVGGATPKRNVASYWDGDIPWITPKDVSNLSEPYIYEAPEYISKAGYKAAATYMLPVGTVLLTSRAPIGNVAIAGIELCTNQGFKSLIPGKNIYNKYLYHCIKKFVPQLELLGNGATFKEVSKKVVENFEIPLPPFEVQKRIADILDKDDGIRQKREKAIKLTDNFLRATFLEMFPQLDDCGNKVKLGDIVTLDAPMVDPREDKFIDLIHIGPDRIERNTGLLLPALTAREENLISKKFLFDENYVLYSKIRPYLKKCAIPDFDGLCSADMYPVKPISGKTNREFIWQLLLSDFFTKYTETLPDRANIPKLNRKELLSFELSLPPISLQEKYKAIVQKTNHAKLIMRKQNGNSILNQLADELFLTN
ncbi:restriction endonuclease subunit S [Escherichia coli]|nr:restriction endonuclease subunit S [Escherichia coli]